MKFQSATHRSRTLETDMTPMIDIVFQLLLFFLTTTQLASMAKVKLDLPRERGEQLGRGEEPGLIVNLRSDGAMLVQDEEVSPPELAAMAARAMAERRARGGPESLRPVVRADRAAPAETLNALLSTLRDAGVEGVTFAVSPGG